MLNARGDRVAGRARRPRRGRYVLAGLLLTVSAIVVGLALGVKPYRIPSSGMEPTLHCPRPASGCEADRGDRILVLRVHWFWTPNRGDLVAFHTPEAARVICGTGGTFVKRLIGLPGETVAIRNGSVVIDGRSLPEPYIDRARRATQDGSWHVPDGAYFVIGDNRDQSCDSRSFGSVPRGKLVGPVVALYWPPDRIGLR